MSGNTVPEVTIEDGVVVEGALEPVLLVLDRPLPLLNSLAVQVLSSEAGLATELVMSLHRLEFHYNRVRKLSVLTILSPLGSFQIRIIRDSV